MKNITSITFIIIAMSFSFCSTKKVVRVNKPRPIKQSEILANVTNLTVPRLLKIDKKVKIIVKGFFSSPGYAISRVDIKRVDNEIGIFIYGKRKQGSGKKFEKIIILPPQRQGEYDVIAYGKNKKLNDIIWVEEYRGEDRNRNRRIRQRRSSIREPFENNG